jgi:nucleotide-binding universal stress UspA family protein
MYKRVLIPVDGSEVAEAIVPFIIDIAGPLDMDVVLLRVNTPVMPVAIEGSRHVMLEDIEGRHREALAYLTSLAKEMETKGLRVETVVRRGEPASEILNAARLVSADLIAMTTHGRTGPARLLFGSVAEGVLRQADIPVFLMRQTERDVAKRHRAATA